MGRHTGAQQVVDLLMRCKYFNLDANPWECPPAAVVNAGLDTIRGYYEELKQDPDPVKVQSLKVVFAGHAGAGKTRYA